MREVFVNQDHARVGFYKSILDSAGIPNLIRNETNNNSVTELPCPLFFPTLVVLNDDDYDEAMRVLRSVYDGPPSALPDWKCAACHEDNPGTFDSCWQCGAQRGAPLEKSGAS